MFIYFLPFGWGKFNQNFNFNLWTGQFAGYKSVNKFDWICQIQMVKCFLNQMAIFLLFQLQKGFKSREKYENENIDNHFPMWNATEGL